MVVTAPLYEHPTWLSRCPPQSRPRLYDPRRGCPIVDALGLTASGASPQHRPQARGQALISKPDGAPRRARARARQRRYSRMSDAEHAVAESLHPRRPITPDGSLGLLIGQMVHRAAVLLGIGLIPRAREGSGRDGCRR